MIGDGGKKNRRADIVAAAFEEFCECGYDRAKMEAIARRAGIGKSTIYEYFPSKADLLSAVGEWIVETASEELDKLLTSEGSFRDMVYQYLRFMHILLCKAGGGLATMLRGGTPVFDLLHKYGDRFRDFVLERVSAAAARAQQRGEISAAIRPKAAAWLIVSMSSPILSLENGEWEPVIQSTLDVLFQGLEPR